MRRQLVHRGRFLNSKSIAYCTASEFTAEFIPVGTTPFCCGE
ncbi:hypothetical protein D8I24_3975 (plasmid) [Cupriavidus necator H850]|nr:hypothetical protein D8I24_3975 [Cupriavidus necator H850]